MKNSKSVELVNLLAQGSIDLSTKFKAIDHRMATEVLPYIESKMPGYGARHRDQVEKIMNMLLPLASKQEMPSDEIFILLCAAQFQCIGLLTNSDETQYPLETYRYIRANYIAWGLDQHVAGMISQVCAGLNSEHFEKLPQNEIWYYTKIRIKFLAALLRMANVLDVFNGQAWNFMLQERRLSPASLDQWQKNVNIAGVEIQPEKWIIKIFIFPESKADQKLLEDFVQLRIQRELDLVIDTLEANSLYYRKVETQLVHELADSDLGKSPYKRTLKVFLCHASQDKPIVHEIYQKLSSEEWIEPWLDAKKLLPGQDWQAEIKNAVETADNVIIFLSNTSINKDGFIQKELRLAKDIALEKTEGSVFLIPLRLDDCVVPRSLQIYQWANYFGDEEGESYSNLLASLKLRFDDLLRKETITKQSFTQNLTEVSAQPETPKISSEVVEQKIDDIQKNKIPVLGLGKMELTKIPESLA